MNKKLLPLFVLTILNILNSQNKIKNVIILPFVNLEYNNPSLFIVSDYISLNLSRNANFEVTHPDIAAEKLKNIGFNNIPISKEDFKNISSKLKFDFLISGAFRKNPDGKNLFEIFILDNSKLKKYDFILSEFENVNDLAVSTYQFLNSLLLKKLKTPYPFLYIDVMGSFWWYPFKGGIAKTYLVPHALSLTFNINPYIGIRIGGFRYWTKTVQNDYSIFIKPDDPLFKVKSFFGAKLGLGFRFYFIRLTFDYEQPVPPGKQPSPLLPYFFLNGSIQVVIINNISIGATLTLYKPRELLNVKYSNSVPVYQIASYKLTYFPGAVISFGF
ncbi:MAG: hypothetical protein QW156_04545 [Candidatus Aenigmatarchaeota archaeon]